MKDIYIGAAYYPELWDESEIEKDILRCKQLGINCLRVGEFAWGSMEPKEGKYEFEWLHRVIEKLYKNGISTVLCTPTCTPPRWMLLKYPEMRRTMHDLTKSDVSSRCHICKSSPVAREKNAQIVTQMAKQFAGEEGIVGWQIDNELFPYGDGCFCEHCKRGFRSYLRERFGTTEKLNKDWGMARWSLEYSDFDEIEPPYPRQWRHPSLRKAWWDYQCNLIKTYVDEQAEILHKFGCNNIGTDMMAQNQLDYCATNEKLDVVQYNHYDTAQRMGTNAFAYDFLRCVKDKPFWVTETQVGWNGSEYADSGYRPVGACYVNSWLPITKGAEMNLYWLFRAHPNGHEIGHGALYSAAGRAYRVSEEVKRLTGELEKVDSFLTNTCILSKIALHYSHTAASSFVAAPLLKEFDYRETLIQKYHAAFRHYNVDVIDTAHSLDGYEVLISPFLATADENGLKERVVDWVKKGGIWIVGPMTDIMDGNVSRYTNAPFGFLEELAGVYAKYQKPIANEVFKAQWSNDGECSVGMCYDAFECNEGTQSLAHYVAGEFAPLSMITERNIGKGKVILVGSVISHGDLLRLVNRAPIAEASDNVILTERSGKESGIIAVEVENESGYLVLNGEYTDLISGKVLTGKIEVSPYEVLVLKK
ncbi:MAG: beta-galactosidase [Lachnospiraceae bacterium]|nr:beta-galactosidase [Lachnospiraceae bacterium]